MQHVMLPEEWRPVPGYEGLYEVSSFGRVRSLYRGKLRFLRPELTHGYPTVSLRLNGGARQRRIHLLVAAAFIGQCPPGQEVRHLDDVKTHNAPCNLIYGTRNENMMDRVRLGTHHYSKRDRCKHGHEFTPENTRVVFRPDGTFQQRRCRTCSRTWGLNYWRKVNGRPAA